MMNKEFHLDKISILRGIAILGIFLFHSQLSLYPNFQVKDFRADHFLNVPDFKSLALNVFPIAYGWISITILILISGFAIHWSFMCAKQSIRFPAFYSKRFWRLYPAYLFVIIVFCHFGKGFHYYLLSRAGLADLLAHLFLVHNLFNKYYFSINPSLWTMALEAQLYLLYPLFLFIRKKSGIDTAIYFSIAISFISFFWELCSATNRILSLQMFLIFGSFGALELSLPKGFL